MSERQYVSVCYQPGDHRSYTYHNDGPPVSIGDQVTVPTNRGLKQVEVVGLPLAAPSFATKAIEAPEGAA